jgi:hypothetical protein
MDSVQYELHEEDAIDFGVVSLRVSSVYPKTIRRVLILGCGVLVAAWALLMLESRDQWLPWTFLVIGIPVFLLAVPKLVWRGIPGALRRQLRAGKNKALLGPQELQLLHDGVKRVHPLSESKVAWSAIEKLVSSQKYFGLYVGAAQALIVPKRSFKSLENEGSFRARVEQLSGKAFAETHW